MQPRFFTLSRRVALAIICAAGLVSGTAWAQNSGSVTDAFDVARKAVKPEMQTKVVSLYGTGTPTVIQKWYIIFYDPTVPSHGRAVLVQNNQVIKTYEARGGTVYSSKLTFDPSRITSEEAALKAAQAYAAKHGIAYETVHALLKQTSVTKPFRWRVELLEDGKSRGYVFINAVDDTVASYASTSTGKSESSDSHSDNDGRGIANDVKDTFLGIGGDLEQFFTGERTVDR